MTIQNRVKLLGRVNLGQLLLFGALLGMWLLGQSAGSFDSESGGATDRMVRALEGAIDTAIQPEDVVFLSTRNPELVQAYTRRGPNTLPLDVSGLGDRPDPILSVLEAGCGNEASAARQIFWVWSPDPGQLGLQWGQTARELRFFYDFQAVLRYQGDEAFAMDKLVRLLPKKYTADRYCEAKRLVGLQPAVLVLDARHFAPWIGAVITGRLTWLSSSPRREMSTSDFAVVDMPPFLAYDVYFMGQVPMLRSWIFQNRDLAAYTSAIAAAKSNGSVVLVDRNARLGAVAARFLRDCPSGQDVKASDLFTQMCLK